MSKRENYISEFVKAFSKAGIEVTEVDGNIGDPQDLEITVVTKDSDGTEHAEGLYFSIDSGGMITRHDFSGSKCWGHAYWQIEAVVKAAFAKGAKWMDADGVGSF